MRRLRARFPGELVAIGVHCGKFPAEKAEEGLREAVLRHGIEHPVVNDPDFEVWESYAVRAWPTLVLIDPDGRIASTTAGEVDFDAMVAELGSRIREFEARGLLDRTPLELGRVAEAAERLLRFPGKLLLEGERLWIADTGHHRILELELDAGGERGELRAIYGSGSAGFADGSAAGAAFHHPHGLALEAGALFVADSDNHAVRRIDLGSGEVSTIAGTGELGRSVRGGGPEARAVPLRSPWALYALDDLLLIAMAGSHQIWALLPSGALGPFAGNGREALIDGSRSEASFNQPSDLAFGFNHLFVADPEASAIRAITFEAEPRVFTLVGQGLFTWGDVDGVGQEVRLQHPTGLAFGGGRLYVADSYNHKVKTLDPQTGRVETLLGTGRAGSRDGAFEEAELSQPEGLAIAGSRLYIADTNNHAIRVADLTARTVKTLALAPSAPTAPSPPRPR